MPSYYLIDSREKTITPATQEMIEERRRIESSTRKLVSAYSNEIQRYLALGYRMKNPYMGFKALTRELERRGVRDPRALAAWIGRRKYGAKQFAKMAAEGRAKRNPESSPERYMLSFFDTRDKMVESGLSPTLDDLAKYAAKMDAVKRGHWALFDSGQLIRGGRLIPGQSEVEWKIKLREHPLKWKPPKYRRKRK